MKNIRLGSISHSSVPPLKETDTIKKAFKIMQKYSISSVIITDDSQKPIGIFTEHDAIKTIANNKEGSTLLSDFMSKDVFYLKENSYTHDAYMLMEQKGFRHIVVVDINEKYLGVVSEGDFLRHMGVEELSRTKNIEDVMRDSILTIGLNTLVTDVALKMSEQKCSYAIIVQDNRPIRILNERDIAQQYLLGEVDQTSTIESIKKKKIHLINKSTSLQDASFMMKEHGVHQLVVVNDNMVLTGLITRHDILKALHSSYFDYLLQTIKNKSEKEKALIKHKEELEKIANYDQLTGLPNRLFFQTYLKKSVAKAIRSKRISAVLMLDLDRFKDINDSYGHSMGDEILNIVSKRLLDRVREGDVVVRLGGDEFAVILEDLTNEHDVANVANSILKTISKTCYLSNGIELLVESSIGIVIIPNDAKDVEKILQYADSALYQAKNNGGANLSFYSDEMTQKAMQKVAYENALRKAIEHNELELYYQPQVHIQTEKIVSAEALLRWHHPDLGIISPDVFIPIAEETGIINSIGKWVIIEACKQGKIFLDKGYHINIAVNVSPNQVKYQNLPVVISEALRETGYSADKLEIEITESSLMQREEDIVEKLHSLRAKGIRLAIDDFGTGYSSLSYLKRFPIDTLKIDKSFIDDIPYSKDDCAIVVAIIEMGKALGYQVLAEGTEQQEQLDFLKEKGCNFYQGYIKSKPVPTKEFEKLLEEQNA